MTVSKMKKIEMMGHKKELDLISYQMIKSKSIQLEDYDEFIFDESWAEEIKSFSGDNPYRELLNKVQEIFKGIDLNYNIESVPEVDKINDLELNAIEEKLIPIFKKVKRIIDFREKLYKEEKRLKNLKKHLWLMRNMEIDLAKLKNLSHISLIFGRVDKYNYERLISNITDSAILILEVYREDDEVWFFSFTKKNYEDKALKFLNAVYFERIELPTRVKGQPRDILKRIEHRLKSIDIAYSEIDLELKKYRHLYGNRLKDLYKKIKLLNKIMEMKNAYHGETDHFFLLNGWIPAYQEKEFIKKLEEEFPGVIYISQEAEEEEKPPTLLKNNYLIKPFESLIELYGIPSYGEIDPSYFVAITYLLIFGMMFGDIGQGIILALFGLAIYRGRIKLLNYKSGLLLIYLGISSTIFGFLYGSVFGLEEILPALWIHPMDNIMYFLQLTVLLGIMLMVIGMIFNLVNAWNTKDIEEGILSRNGLSGLVFYIFSLITMYFFLLEKELLFNIYLTIFLLIAPLLLIFFREPLFNLIRGKEDIWPEDIGSYYLESGFELFDTVISFLSNTISFVRIGAFTLNHIGLFMAVFILAEMLGEVSGGIIWSSLIIFLGNLFIMILEGLVVGIQVLRLEYFELFAKFYKGNGKKFSPVKLE
jgi:V/A-type H+-transporting ATPase subunit I